MMSEFGPVSALTAALYRTLHTPVYTVCSTQADLKLRGKPGLP